MDPHRREKKRDHRKRGDDANLHRPRRRLIRNDVGHQLHIRDRLRRIGLVDDPPHRRRELRHRRRRADHEILRHEERKGRARLLPVREVHLRLAGPLETPHMHVTDDADDFHLARRRGESLPDRIFTGEILLGKRFAHHGDARPVEFVRLGKIAPHAQRDSHRRKKSRRRVPHARVATVRAIARLAVRRDGKNSAGHGHRQERDVRGRLCTPGSARTPSSTRL